MTSPGGVINNFAIHPNDPNKVAAATTSSNKVLITEDGGQTWTPWLLNLPSFSSLAVVWDSSDVNGLYLGMDYGVYYIDDTFSEWQIYNNNLPNVIINELEINNFDGMIYAGSYGRGLWASPVVNLILSAEDFLDGSQVAIYPNPAHDELKIVLEESLEADIRVFDMSGKLVINNSDVMIENHHSVNISTLTKGIYFIRINSNKGAVTKKFIKQ
ncbi:MAG: T9SS type A sorting domain-containing protein [Flavobacteriaceae bacterium]|nr:T9SS type A sorting domain-containing protein [Flavobacteriaceae bacterium]